MSESSGFPPSAATADRNAYFRLKHGSTTKRQTLRHEKYKNAAHKLNGRRESVVTLSTRSLDFDLCLRMGRDSDSEEPLYSATISVPHVVNGQCQKTVTVEGNGVNDEIEVPCYMESSIITTNNQLTVGNMIFSNTANTLVVVRDNRCVLKTYKDGKVAGSSPLSRQDCAMVKKVMREVRQNDDAKKWGKWADGVAAAASLFNPAENPDNRFQSFLQLWNIGKH
ncbi:hypothetical protein J6590_041356 [Homalodisca vitripennis]|nr:hypothetical protein J6590_041356 [Homalodisca vitripennis]